MEPQANQAGIVSLLPTSRLSHRVGVIGLIIASMGLGVLYFTTAIGKGTQIPRTAVVIESIIPVGSFVAHGTVLFIVASELVLAGMLISGFRLGVAGLSSLTLSIAFFVWHFLVWLQPGAIDCGCGAPPIIKKLIGDANSGVLLAGLAFVLSGIVVLGCFRRGLEK